MALICDTGPLLAALDAADPDHDGPLTKDEYLAIVEQLFKKADVDNEGTLTTKELKSKAGRALKRGAPVGGHR